jgi:hypothetical protein
VDVALDGSPRTTVKESAPADGVVVGILDASRDGLLKAADDSAKREGGLRCASMG